MNNANRPTTAEEMRSDPNIFKRKISDIEDQASVAILPVEDWGSGRRIIVAGISGAQAGRAHLKLIDITGQPQVATFDWHVAKQPHDDEYAIIIRPGDGQGTLILEEDGNFVLVHVETEPQPEPRPKPDGYMENHVTGDGQIHKSVQYSVWCATCDAMLDYEGYRNQVVAIKYYRSLDWRKTKLGWQCPKCMHDRKSEWR